MNRSQHQPKLKPPPRALFTCGIFRHCTQSVLSPTTPPATFPPSTPPSPASPPPPPQLPASNPYFPADCDSAPTCSSSSSSSSSASQSFTQWRFLLHYHHRQEPEPRVKTPEVVASSADHAEAFRTAELQFSSGARLSALRLLERSLAPDSTGGPCPPAVMAGVVASLRESVTALLAAKVLLALLLADPNRRAAVEAGEVGVTVEAVASTGPSGGLTAERALAALELLCTVEAGEAEARGHALAAPTLAGAADGMGGRGRECAIGVLAAVYGGEGGGEAPGEVGIAVMATLQGECSARGRWKGAQLLRALQESGRLDIAMHGW